MTRGTPEARLEQACFKEIARIQREVEPRLVMAKNEVGVGYRAALKHALIASLKPFGDAITDTVLSTMRRHYITYGLGVGSPDLIGSYVSRRCDLELKTDKGVVSDDQIDWHVAARSRGQFVTVIRSPDEIWPALQRCAAGEVE